MPAFAPTPVDAPRSYLDRGYAVVPVPDGQKRSVLSGWTSLRLTDADLEEYFPAWCNIGILLGEPSGWLVDVDLDCGEALELADQHLPPTDAESGRNSRPRSHRWYIAPGAVTKRFKDPASGHMLVELRSTGSQTVVGPGRHPDGDSYHMLEGEPAVVDADELLACVSRLVEAVCRARGVEPRRAGPRPPRRHAASDIDIPNDHRLYRAIRYLAAMPEAISGQGGHGRTYAAATALVHGFGLDTDTALDMLLTEYNPRCVPPWTDKELMHKVEDAATKPHEKPHGWLLNGAEERVKRPEPTPSGRCERLGSVDPPTGRIILCPRRTLPTAEAYVRRFHDHPDGRTLQCQAGLLLEWRGNSYRELDDDAVRHRLQPWLHEALRPSGKPSDSDGPLADFESNPTTVNAALDSIRSLVHIPTSLQAPAWIGGDDGRPPAIEVLACRGVNLHLPTGRTFEPTPRLLTRNALEFDYEPGAPQPERWLAFVEQLWEDDAESIGLLQEWMGYCLTPDTSQQKMLLIVGPKRSGKGTIGRVLARLVGASNVAGPTTSGLAGPFGLQPLLDKSVAIVSDARFTGEGVATVSERLLCISGEDTLTIDRKYLPPVTVKLPTRFVFMSNELPRFGDASGALPARFLVLRLTNSFYGREDPALLNQLLAELPGILNWAIEGARRLRARGRFSQPDSAAEAVRELEALASPVLAFLRDKCVVRPGARVDVDNLFTVWTEWCGREVIRHGDKQSFGRDLTAAAPGVRRRRGTGNVSFYEGVGLSGGDDQ